MLEFSSDDENKKEVITIEVYEQVLKEFDASVCEALAVGQQSSGRLPEAYIGYSSKIFARLCAHAHCMIRAAPMTRWVKTTYHDWDLSEVAGHTRAIMEGYLFYMYLSSKPNSEDEFAVKLKVMHINDCVRRIKIFTSLEDERVSFYLSEHERLKLELNESHYFQSLPEPIRKQSLSGRYLMIDTRDELLAKFDVDKKNFDMIFDILSNYIHILPISFYNFEPNGRGSGLFNQSDLEYLYLCMQLCTELLKRCTDRVVEFFPDVQEYRNGSKSIINPGPRENLPQIVKERQNTKKKRRRK
ncbi:hypothetical protein EJP80_18920 [Rahnella aquatilis]|nr:hypothetical protein EJP80_18920 [Rahnella aquatilis]